MTPLQRLWEADDLIRDPLPSGSRRGGGMPQELARLYDGDLAVDLRPDRPTLVANFVTTLDGVVALGEPGTTGGGEISGFAEVDRFVMALLRALADAVVVGGGTLRAAPGHEWTPRGIHPPSAPSCAAWRTRLGLAGAQPRTVVVSGSGQLDPSHRGLRAPDVPVTVVTTRAGHAHLAGLHMPPGVRVATAGAGTRVEPEAILATLRADGASLALCEGGPHLIAGLLAAGLADELFLTLAPQVVGRDDAVRRLALVEGLALPAGPGRWADLRSVRRGGDLLFLRYRFGGAPRVS